MGAERTAEDFGRLISMQDYWSLASMTESATIADALRIAERVMTPGIIQDAIERAHYQALPREPSDLDLDIAIREALTALPDTRGRSPTKETA